MREFTSLRTILNPVLRFFEKVKRTNSVGI